MQILLLNEPNLNLLGQRETSIYGNQDFDSFFKELKAQFPTLQLDYFQSNVEGEIINKLQEAGFSYDGIVLNAGAYTHTSVGIGDGVKVITAPVIEVHISNAFAIEIFVPRSCL